MHNNIHSIFAMMFSSNIGIKAKNYQGTCDTSQIGGKLGGIWEASGGSQRLQEAKGLQEAANHTN
jgi:hypothetical protein